MHGQIDSILNHVPAGSNHLIVTGRFVADDNAEVGIKADEIKATLTIGSDEVECSTKSHGTNTPIVASLFPGTPWTMLVGTDACGPESSTADAFDAHGNSLAHWAQPRPQIVVY